jgi:hypothetical protein
MLFKKTSGERKFNKKDAVSYDQLDLLIFSKQSGSIDD